MYSGIADFGSAVGQVSTNPELPLSMLSTKAAAILLFSVTPRDFPSGAIFIPPIPSTGHVNLPGLQFRPSEHDAVGRPPLNLPRLLLADDHQPLLSAEIALLTPHFDIVGTAADGAALVLEACRLHPDVIVTDISMPVLNGIEAAQKLRELGSTAKFVFVTVHSEREFVEACVQAGALGYVHKRCLSHHLVPAIKAALAGQSYEIRS
jgi:CheY-like chemotaxis protein